MHGLSHKLAQSQLRPPGIIKMPYKFLCSSPLEGNDHREKLFTDNPHLLCVDSPPFTEISALARAWLVSSPKVMFMQYVPGSSKALLMVSRHSSVTMMGSHTTLLDTWHVGSETTVQTSVGRLVWEERTHYTRGVLLTQFIDTLHWCPSFMLVPVYWNQWHYSDLRVVLVIHYICILYIPIHFLYTYMWILYKMDIYIL